MKQFKINKTHYLIISILFMAVFTIGCKKYLDAKLQGQPTIGSDPNLAPKLVTGVYNDLLTGDTWGYGNDVHGFSYIAATNIISDDADKGSFPADQPGIGDFDNFTINSSNIFVNALWNGYYVAIHDANYAIQSLNSSNLDANTKNEYLGEVRFLRGYFYFNLIRMFGAVPKITRIPKDANDATSGPTFNTRVSPQTIYDSVIIPDLEFAAANTPLKSAASVGHVTKGAAQTLLAKVYMYLKSWTNVLNLTDSVMNSSQYQLMADYSIIWRPEGNNCAESIFEIESGVFNNTDLGIQLYSECQGPRSGGAGGWTDLGWGFCTPTTTLINSYEPGDLRKNATVIFIDNSGNHVGTYLWDGFRVPSSDSVQNLYYNYKAYNSEIDTANPLYHESRDFKEKNVHLIRYAEVILMNAEAANELGQAGTAINDLNVIRTRAGLPNTTASSQPDLRTAIWNERHVELALEHDRFWDLVRQGRAAQVMQASGKAFVQGKNELLPIPSVQIALSNGRLTQNNGY